MLLSVQLCRRICAVFLRLAERESDLAASEGGKGGLFKFHQRNSYRLLKLFLHDFINKLKYFTISISLDIK